MLALRRAVASAGASGNGKTTLLQLIAGLVAADEGDVDVGGTSLRKAARTRLRTGGPVTLALSQHSSLAARDDSLPVVAASLDPDLLAAAYTMLRSTTPGPSRLWGDRRS
jgi:ABC-type thiamine transport system ATPase subunit